MSVSIHITLESPWTNVDCTDTEGNTSLRLSTYSSRDRLTDRLLTEETMDNQFRRGPRETLDTIYIIAPLRDQTGRCCRDIKLVQIRNKPHHQN